MLKAASQFLWAGDRPVPPAPETWAHLLCTCWLCAGQARPPGIVLAVDKPTLRQFPSPLHHRTLFGGVVGALQLGQEPGWVSWSEQPRVSQEQDGLINHFRL